MIIYKTSSSIQFLFSLLLRIAYVCVAAIALYHYNENPVVTLAVAFVCALFFLLTGQDNITVSSYAIEYSSSSILRVLRNKKVFKIAEIKAIKTEGIFSTGDELYNPTMIKDKPLNTIEIELKNGSTVKIPTSIYIDKLKRVELEINNLLQK
jgi:hypothetical protein